ncbi:hypothetical protein EniLVp02_0231 [Vibrio phage EniLVp02]
MSLSFGQWFSGTVCPHCGFPVDTSGINPTKTCQICGNQTDEPIRISMRQVFTETLKPRGYQFHEEHTYAALFNRIQMKYFGRFSGTGYLYRLESIDGRFKDQIGTGVYGMGCGRRAETKTPRGSEYAKTHPSPHDEFKHIGNIRDHVFGFQSYEQLANWFGNHRLLDPQRVCLVVYRSKHLIYGYTQVMMPYELEYERVETYDLSVLQVGY